MNQPPQHLYPLRLHRHAASPRGVARAGEIWRLAQEVAVQAAILAGWPPERFVDEGVAFIIARMCVTHAREIPYGSALMARTWVGDFRRGILTRREVRLFDEHGPLAAASQGWVHVSAAMKPARASAELMSCFPPEISDDPSPALPEIAEKIEGRKHHFGFEVWHTWMDPLGHVNHPVYVDWSDEATSRVLAQAGVDPQRLVPVAEEVQWRRSATAGQQLVVETQLLGQTAAGDAVLQQEILTDTGESVAIATCVRRLQGEDGIGIVDILR